MRPYRRRCIGAQAIGALPAQTRYAARWARWRGLAQGIDYHSCGVHRVIRVAVAVSSHGACRVPQPTRNSVLAPIHGVRVLHMHGGRGVRQMWSHRQSCHTMDASGLSVGISLRAGRTPSEPRFAESSWRTNIYSLVSCKIGRLGEGRATQLFDVQVDQTLGISRRVRRSLARESR